MVHKVSLGHVDRHLKHRVHSVSALLQRCCVTSLGCLSNMMWVQPVACSCRTYQLVAGNFLKDGAFWTHGDRLMSRPAADKMSHEILIILNLQWDSRVGFRQAAALKSLMLTWRNYCVVLFGLKSPDYLFLNIFFTMFCWCDTDFKRATCKTWPEFEGSSKHTV